MQRRDKRRGVIESLGALLCELFYPVRHGLQFRFAPPVKRFGLAYDVPDVLRQPVEFLQLVGGSKTDLPADER